MFEYTKKEIVKAPPPDVITMEWRHGQVIDINDGNLVEIDGYEYAPVKIDRSIGVNWFGDSLVTELTLHKVNK